MLQVRAPAFIAALLLLCAVAARAQSIPAAPVEGHILDTTHTLAPPTLTELDRQISDYETATGNHLMVAVVPSVPAPLTVGDFGSLLVKSWNVERSGKGALLVVCINSRKLNISTGPAMHKVISNATCQRIIDNDITPAFKREDYEQGIRAGITSIILASQGNYHATTTDFLADHVSAIVWIFILGIIGISMFASSVRNKYGPTRDAGGSIPLWAASFILLAIVFDFLGRGSWGSSDSSSSSSSSGDSGGGGGGASGSW